MQIRSDFTKEKLMASHDPLFETCHSLERLHTISSFLYAYPDGPFEMEKSAILGASTIIQDATKEISFIVDIANDQWREESRQSQERMETLERVLKNFIDFLEDPGDKPNLEQMVENLKRQMKQ